MTATVWFGLVLTLFAGLLSGNCMLPMKFVKRWAWENTWMVFSVVSLIILPWALGLALVKDLSAVYASLPASAFVAPLLYGAGWGIAQVLFGLSIVRLGMALGYAIIIGLGAMLGTLVPLLVQHGAVAGTSRGLLIFCGIFVMLLGIAVSAAAGRMREAEQPVRTAQGSYASAVLLAVICGLMAPMINYAFAFGQPIADAAIRSGTSATSASYAVWPVGLLGGFVPNAIYCFYLLSRNGTWANFRTGWISDGRYGIAMGVLWLSAVAIYGVSSVYL